MNDVNKKREAYYSEQKENVNFLLGLSGVILAILAFHYALYKIRVSEYFKVSSDLLNETMLIDGIRTFVEVIVLVLMMVSIYLFSTLILRSKLSGNTLSEFEDKKSSTKAVGSVSLFFVIILLLTNSYFEFGYQGNLPPTKQAFVLLNVLLIVQIVIITINFVLTLRDDGGKTYIAVPVAQQMLYVLFVFFFILAPYVYMDRQVSKTDKIVVTDDSQFMFVEKESGSVVLRKMKPKNEECNEYYLTDDYVVKDAKKVVLRVQPIMETINFEKEGYLKFEVEGKN